MNAKEVMAKPIIITTKRISIARSSKKQKPGNASSGRILFFELTRLAVGLGSSNPNLILLDIRPKIILANQILGFPAISLGL
jgi:hypothetical protein